MPLPDVILLNGASCAGKTSIAKAIQQLTWEPMLRMGVDDFVPLLSSRYLGHRDGVQFVPQADGSVPMRIGAVGMRVLEAFHSAVRGAVTSGICVIAEDVMLDPRLLPHWLTVLQGRDVFFVGVKCSLAELERRERSQPERAQGHARTTFESVHAHAEYDLVVDTTSTSSEACAQQILAAIAARAGRSTFDRLAVGKPAKSVERAMQTAVVAYPDVPEGDRTWIEGIRKKHDPQSNVIAAHFTLVFPADIGAAAVAEHVALVLANVRQVPFVLTRAVAVRHDQRRGGQVFLVPSEGAKEIRALHERLYTGPLEPHVRRDISFTPHLTVAASDSFEQCEAVARSLNNQQRTVAGRIVRLDIIESLPTSVRTLSTVELGRAT
jgi:chloramphenicol 3-O phosphotransferase